MLHWKQYKDDIVSIHLFTYVTETRCRFVASQAGEGWGSCGCLVIHVFYFPQGKCFIGNNEGKGGVSAHMRISFRPTVMLSQGI